MNRIEYTADISRLIWRPAYIRILSLLQIMLVLDGIRYYNYY